MLYRLLLSVLRMRTQVLCGEKELQKSELEVRQERQYLFPSSREYFLTSSTGC